MVYNSGTLLYYFVINIESFTFNGLTKRRYTPTFTGYMLSCVLNLKYFIAHAQICDCTGQQLCVLLLKIGKTSKIFMWFRTLSF